MFVSNVIVLRGPTSPHSPLVSNSSIYLLWYANYETWHVKKIVHEVNLCAVDTDNYYVTN